jgi:dipeptidyl aminopeptidase/acylaminoacyl peptidase
MPRRRAFLTASPLFVALGLVFALAGPAPDTGLAQGTRADYDRAQGLAQRTENTVFRSRVRAEWLPGASRFWYRIETGPGTHEFIVVDAQTGVREPLFNHEAAAQAAKATLSIDAKATALPFERLEVVDEGKAAVFRAAGKRWRMLFADSSITPDVSPDKVLRPRASDRIPRRSRTTGDETEITFVNQTQEDVELFWLDTEGARQAYGRIRPGQERRQHTFAGHVWLAADRQGTTVAVFEADTSANRALIEEPTARQAESKPKPEPPVATRRPERGESPDGRWIAFVRDHNLQLRERTADASTATALSTDGTADDAYSADVTWSPDSSAVVARRVQKGEEHLVHFVEALPKDQVQPKLHSNRYLKPGDKLPRPLLRVFTVADRRQWNVDESLYPTPFTESGDLDIQWTPDSREFRFTYNQRGHQVFRILAVDPRSGQPGESTKPGLLKPRIIVDETSPTFVDWTAKTWHEWLPESGELLWMSERDGWCHLWLYDVATGQVKNQVTRGEWIVRKVESVDRKARQVWFYAGGIRPGEDPYYQHLCRVNFDGTGLTILTEGDGTHSATFSPDRRWFIDTWSRVDQPPVTELRRSSTGQKVCELERADWSRLIGSGWTIPERFVAPGRDSKTPIYGIVIKPSNFDPSVRYPVIEEIYAGPQGAFVPKEFGRLTRQHALAELGFVIVQIDGMGTSQRSKAFHDVCWKNLGDSGFPDRIPWMREAARTRPWMDLTRVGVYGGSAGGQSSTRALLAHGDFYKVAVSDCGCHDNRMDKIWWNEQWMGWPLGPHYAEQSNVTQAKNLTGKLLLIVGEVDSNVDPASTLQVAAALVRADKDFDLLIMPSANHGAAESPYGTRRRQDFFVRHLHGHEPRWK